MPAATVYSGSETWVFNAPNNAWDLDTGPAVLTLGQAIFEIPEGKSINELKGKITQLQGPIDALSGPEIILPALMKGTVSGDVIQQDYSFDQDWDGDFEFLYQGVEISDPVLVQTLQELLVKFEANLGSGNVVLEVSYDGVTWKGIRTVAIATATAPVLKNVRAMEGATGNELYWRLRATGTNIRLLGFWVQLLKRFRQV